MNRKKISGLLIGLGVIFLLFPTLLKTWEVYRQQQIVDAFLLEVDQSAQHAHNYQDLTQTYEELNASQEELITKDIQNATELMESYELSENQTKPITIQKLPVIGIIQIEKINLKLPIVENTTSKALKMAIGHMEQTTSLGAVGNCVLAGHRGITKGYMFNRLNEIEIGDQIRVENKQGKYVYRVYEILLVEPTDLSVLNSTTQGKVITLITCDPILKGTHRIIIHGIIDEK